MNLIINQSCNRNCSFCFANIEEHKQINEDMSREYFESLVKRIPDMYIRIMGGEPTLHPLFLDFLDIVFKHNKIPVVFSNFLFDLKILNGLIERLSENKRIIFLANLSSLNDFLMKVAADNYSKIYKTLSDRNRTNQLSCSLTIDIRKPEECNLDYVKRLIAKGVIIEGLRFCMMAPNFRIYEVKEFKDRFAIGDNLVELCKYCTGNHIEATIAETIYPCIFRNLDDYYFVKGYWMEGRDFECYTNPPADVFSDNTISFCFPLKDRIRIGIDDLSMAVPQLLKEFEPIKKVSDTCKTCIYYKSHCKGACPAWS